MRDKGYSGLLLAGLVSFAIVCMATLVAVILWAMFSGALEPHETIAMCAVAVFGLVFLLVGSILSSK